jgi:signal transduction histidine kinase
LYFAEKTLGCHEENRCRLAPADGSTSAASSEPEHMKKLGDYIITAFAINVFAIMSVGGLCILLVKDMVHNITILKSESEKVAKFDEVNNKIPKMLIAVHHSIIESAPDHMLTALAIVDELHEEVVAYQTEEEYAGADDGNAQVLLQKIQDHLLATRDMLLPAYKEFSTNGTINPQELTGLEEMGNSVQYLTGVLNKGRFDNIARLVNESYEKMALILFLYLTASFIGILASCVAYVVLTRHTITPLKRLATATRKVAGGDLSTRIQTASRTEIGTLYESFNIMTARLQQHEKRREDFSRELEQKVAARTSELGRANLSLKKAQADLIRMEKIATMGQIATAVNHEIKTPLNSLYMNLQLLTKQIKKHVGEKEEARATMLEVASIIDGEIARINGIIEEFVKYARFAPSDLKQNDLNELLKGVAGMISQNAQQTGVTIRLSLAEEVNSILLDKKKMTQALLNLCVNAIQAMPGGGTLTIQTAKTSHHVIITIADTGTGIAAEDIDRIFDPFFTRKEGGLGFGLPIVRRIIEDHQGQITCRSTAGEYTLFEIVLPL